MEFAPVSAALPTSKSASAMAFADPAAGGEAGGQAASPATATSTATGGRPGSAPPSLSFEGSALFGFGGTSDFFTPMKYDDEEPTGNENGRSAGDASNNDILPPHALSPTNQREHETLVPPVAVTTPSAAPSMTLAAASKSPALPMLPSHHSRRKNSIEVFLSQSPSQALGGDFLKLSLDDRQMMNRAGGNGAAAAGRGSRMYASGSFRLDDASPKKFGRLASYRNQQAQQQQHQQQQQQEVRYRGDVGVPAGSAPLPPPPLTITRSSTVPGTSSGYGAPSYPLSPHMSSSEESWSGSQDGDSYYASEHGPPPPVPSTITMHDYYGGGAASNAPAPQYRQYQRSSRQDMYRSSPQPPPPPSQSGGYGYGHAQQSRHALGGNGQWGPAAHPYEGMYMNAPPPQQQSPMSYHAPLGMRGGRSTPRHMYGRMTGGGNGAPPLPESSPPHSPRRGPSSMSMGAKQCKFFQQGHCRMGSKCKFAHHADHMGGGRMAYGGGGGRMALSPSPPPHMMSHHGHHHGQQQQMSGDEMGYNVGRQSSRLAYRSSSSNDLDGSNAASGSASSSASLAAMAMGGGALSVSDIEKRVFAMSKDQNGCRLLQEQLDYADRTDLRDVIFRESLDHLAEMMVDPFGNYLFQKLLERVAGAQRLAIVRRVRGHLVAAALNLHGTRSVQKVVEVCATSPEVVETYDPTQAEDEDEPVMESNSSSDAGTRQERVVHLPDLIVEALREDAVRLCIDSNGNHVIQRALQFLPAEHNQFVFDAVCRECTTVGTHRHGCCVLQRCLDAANSAQKAAVIAQVERQAMKLMQDPYGNYVVQYVLDACSAEEALGVMLKPLGHLLELSVQKFSSNVVEKCLEKAPERVRQRYVEEITRCPKLGKMLQDQFANYVVQRALCVCSEEQCGALVRAIRPHLAAMKNTSGGRRITARILKRFPGMDIGLDAVAPAGNVMMGDGSFDGGLMLAGPPQHLAGNGGTYGHYGVARYPSHGGMHPQQSAFGGGLYGGGTMNGHYMNGGGLSMNDVVGGGNSGNGMGMNAASRA